MEEKEVNLIKNGNAICYSIFYEWENADHLVIWLFCLEKRFYLSFSLHFRFFLFRQDLICFVIFTSCAGICCFGLLFWVENFHLPIFSRLVMSIALYGNDVDFLFLFLNFLFSLIFVFDTNFPHFLNIIIIIIFWFFQIKPLVKPTRYIVDMDAVEYSWHDFVSRSKQPNSFTLHTLMK